MCFIQGKLPSAGLSAPLLGASLHPLIVPVLSGLIQPPKHCEKTLSAGMFVAHKTADLRGCDVLLYFRHSLFSSFFFFEVISEAKCEVGKQSDTLTSGSLHFW